MTRPHKRSDSSFLFYRKRVPDDLKQFLGGKTEIKISLRTRDPVEAKIAHAKVAAEVEARWAQLRRGVISVSQKQAVAMAGEIYRELVSAHEENPGEPGSWKGSLLIDWGFLRPEKNVKVHMMGRAPEESRKMFEQMRLNRHSRIVQDYLDRHGYRVDNESLVRIKKAANEAIMQGREQLLRNAEGDYRPDPDAGRFPELELNSQPITPGNVPLGQASPLDVFDRYAKESKPTPATIKRWRPVVAKVQKEHPIISGITPEWCIQWKNKLVASGLSNNTIRNGYLASMRALCNWAVTNREMANNPFKDVTVKADKQRKMRQKGLLDSEVLTILAATLVPAPKSFSSQHAAARRWVPWLCAYLGARIGEVGQLRGMDIKQEEGVWLVWITPDAGSTKNESARYVALHPHLIEQGFLRFVQKSGNGPLFYDPQRRRNGSAQNPQYKKIGERIAKWVRELGVDDPNILPNHAWRHRFKTVARKVKMDVGARDYMQGHVPATEGEAYGDFTPDVLLDEISKLPRIEIKAGVTPVEPQRKPIADDAMRVEA
jgi:integrase